MVSAIGALVVRLWLPDWFHMPLFILMHSLYMGMTLMLLIRSLGRANPQLAEGRLSPAASCPAPQGQRAESRTFAPESRPAASVVGGNSCAPTQIPQLPAGVTGQSHDVAPLSGMPRPVPTIHEAILATSGRSTKIAHGIRTHESMALGTYRNVMSCDSPADRAPDCRG